MQNRVGAATTESPIGNKQDDGAGAFALQHDLNARTVHWASMISIDCAHVQEEMAGMVKTLGKDGDGNTMTTPNRFVTSHANYRALRMVES